MISGGGNPLRKAIVSLTKRGCKDYYLIPTIRFRRKLGKAIFLYSLRIDNIVSQWGRL